MMFTFILLLLFSIRPLYTYGKEAYIGFKLRDFPKVKANLLFLGITSSVIIGLTAILIKN